MMIQKRNKRPIGRILLDGGFLPPHNLEAALEEQKRTNELLGQVLVRMGVLDPADIAAALSVQEHLDRAEDAVKIAAGTRQVLGALLIQAGHITNEQLELAIAEQKRTGEKIGEVFVRQGLLTARQLDRLLDFQRNQSVPKPSPGPLRLGEILVSTGAISRGQLEDALRKQTGSQKKLGEVLVEEGYVQPHHIKRGIRIQRMLLTSVLVAVLSLESLTGCGSGGGGGAAETPVVVATNVEQEQARANYFTVTYDEYGLLQPNFYYSTNNDDFWSIQANVAEDVWDPNFKTIIRIDIPKSEQGVLPDISGKTFSIEDNAQFGKFPGAFLVFNGQQSVLKKVEQGTVSFTADSTASEVTGEFDVTLTDYDSTAVPPPKYRLRGMFSFKMGTSGPASPLSAEAFPRDR